MNRKRTPSILVRAPWQGRPAPAFLPRPDVTGLAEYWVDGIPINPMVPMDLFNCPSARPRNHWDWKDVPFVCERIGDPKLHEGGSYYTVHCLDLGGGDLEGVNTWGPFPTLRAAVDFAKNGPGLKGGTLCRVGSKGWQAQAESRGDTVLAEGWEDGIPVNPELPLDLWTCPEERRPASHLDWEDVPFIRMGFREPGPHSKGGMTYTVHCLCLDPFDQIGVQDWGTIGSLAKAVHVAKSGPGARAISGARA